MSRKSILPPETLELYDRVFETYKQEVKLNPDYSFSSHCKQWNVNAFKLNKRLCREGIFINKLKQESRERLTEESIRQAQRMGAFVSIQPENEAMSGWRNTEIPRVEIYLPGKIRLTVKKGTAANVISLISTYAEKEAR